MQQLVIRINRKLIKLNKQIAMKNFAETTGKEYVLAKFEPGNILLINRHTKKPYNYFETQSSLPLRQQLHHEHLLRPLFYGNGLLYLKGESNFHIEFQNRKRSHSKDYFTEQQLLNTFQPIFQCVQFLHSNNIIHAEIHPQNMLLIDGEIKLRDWLVSISHNAYYSKQKKQERTQFDDFHALGIILTEYSTLRKFPSNFNEKDLNALIEPIIDIYTKNLIFLLLTLLKSKTQLFPFIVSHLQGKSNKIIDHPQLNEIYSKIKADKMQKILKSQPQQKVTNIMATPKKSQNIVVQSSPNKKFNITQTTKKTNRSDDTENKKVFNQEVKKRQIEKITKIIERSNAFVNELMARKNNSQFGILKNNSEHNGVKNFGQVSNQPHVLKKISGKNNVNLGATMNNMSMYAVEQTKKVKQIGIGVTFSPNKRLRTISRKK